MNLKKIIVAMALAAGLLSSGTQAQAGVVINNYLFTPITIKMSYTDSSSGKKVKVTNKSILNDLGYPAGTQLVYWDGDVYAINQNLGIFDDLSNEGYLYVEFDYSSYSSYYKANGTYVYDESGYLYVAFFDDGYDYVPDDYFAFESEGTYSYTETESVDNAQGYFKETTSFSSTDQIGDAYIDYDSYYDYISGSTTGNGSGQILD